MISQILQRLDSLQVELFAIDPTRDFEAADKVAGIAAALRRAASEAIEPGSRAAPSDRRAPARQAA